MNGDYTYCKQAYAALEIVTRVLNFVFYSREVQFALTKVIFRFLDSRYALSDNVCAKIT